MIEDTTPCSVENIEEDAAEEKKQHKKYDVATAKYNPFSVNCLLYTSPSPRD